MGIKEVMFNVILYRKELHVMQKIRHSLKRGIALSLSAVMTISLMSGIFENTVKAEEAEEKTGTAISNGSLSIEIGDLGQISTMNIVNNRKNGQNNDVNFVLPNDTSPQNNEAHQWMGEMIFSYRTSEDGKFPEGRKGFVEVDTNKTLAAGGSKTASEIKEDNPYITKKQVSDKEVEVTFKGVEGDAGTQRSMKGFNVTSNYNMDTEDGSLLWNITLQNTGNNYIEFGDVGLPMPWNNKYTGLTSVYNDRVTAHTFAGADSGYAYAIRCSGEGNYVLFTPVPESGARIEYVDNWVGNNNQVKGERAGETFANWTSDSGGWQPGLSVYYIHSKDIQKTGRGYYTDATSLVLEPGKSKTYTFKFSAVRAGDNTPQESAESANNASDSVEERENNMRSILYKSGMIDAIAVPGFQTALNMETKLDLHYDDAKIKVDSVDIQCVHENDPFDEKHIPEQTEGLVNNSRSGKCANNDSVSAPEAKTVDGENHHIYNLKFGCIGNNSVRVNYKLKVGDAWVDKFTQYEFNALESLDKIVETHADFMVNKTQDNDPKSPTYGNYQDWYISQESVDKNALNHWGDDWSHDNINFMTMKNYLNPVASEVESIEKYLVDYMWNNYMKNTQDSYTVANYLNASGIYSDTSSPYTRTYSEMMEATGFFNMYRIQKAYPDLIEYRQTPEWYLEKAYGIYINRVSSYPIGYYGEQQVPDMIEVLKEEGMTDEAGRLQKRFAQEKGTRMSTAAYPYGSEFAYDNTGEEGAYAAAKALREYYPDDANAGKALSNMKKAEWKTRAMRGIQPTWYHYADPVFIGGEHWWNFQYTASLAGSIMDDWLRYQDNGWDTASSAWAERVNYAAKLSNFNAVNMGQISDKSIGSVSWRYTMYKGGHGAMNVNDGGTRVMNNGWNDFSGESEEGLYGSLLRISSDVVTDPVFGLTGYGSTVSKEGTSYTVTPADGVGKRINIIDDKLYAELEQDSCTKAVINSAGPSFELSLKCLSTEEHLSRIKLSGAGLKDGYYSILLDRQDVGQCYVKNHEGVANVLIPAGKETAVVSVSFEGEGTNEAPVVKTKAVVTDKTEGAEDTIKAVVPFRLESIAYDDGAPNGTLTYKWEVTAPEGGKVTLGSPAKPYTTITCSKEGTYTAKLTVSDGEKDSVSTLDINVGAAPEKTAPVIGNVTAVQEEVNTSVARMTGEATSDKYYKNEELKYNWTVVEQPEGGSAIIADADTAKASMKAYKPGAYKIRLTVTDEDTGYGEGAKSSQKDIVIDMTGKVDGVERTGTVLTSTGTAPELPETMEVIHSDGTIQNSEVVWSEIDASSYAQEGSFEVTGTVPETEIKTAVNVRVVAGSARNMAIEAIPTAIIDTPQDLGGVAGLNDGYEPESSNDKSHGVWHNWLGDQSGPAWVQYTWEEPVVIYQSDAYYFTDGNFVPKTVKYEYLDEDGETWRNMVNVKGCGTELNKYNTTTFEPVSTKAVRMTMMPKTLGCGVIEWKVFGYGKGADKMELRRQINQANSINIGIFAEEAKDMLETALAEAQAVFENKEATQEEVDQAAEKLAKVIVTLPTTDNNLAYTAKVTTSYVSGWESLAAANDGRLTGTSFNPPGPRYGSWGHASEFETITYTWENKVRLNGADIYFWYDGENETNGGINFPESYSYEYLDDNGEWKEVENPSSYEPKKDSYSLTTFSEIETTAIRVKMNKIQTIIEDGEEVDMSGCGVGIQEWKVYDASAGGRATEVKVSKAPLKTEYIRGEKLDTTGLELEVTYADNSVKTFTNNYKVSGYDRKKLGEQTVTVTFADITTEFKVTVKEDKVDKTALSAKITQAMRLTASDYTQKSYDALQKALQEAKAVYDDAEAVQDEVAEAEDALTAAIENLVERKPVSIRFKTEPTQNTYFAGEPIHSSTFELEAVYADDSTEVITEGFEISGYNAEQLGEQTVTVTYKEQSVQFVVTVEEAQKLENEESKVSVLAAQIEEGVKLLVEKAASGDEQVAEMLGAIAEKIKEALGVTEGVEVTEDNSSVLDIKLVKGEADEEVQLEEDVVVSIPKPEGYSNNLKLFHNRKDGLTEINFTLKEEKELVFRTGEFSHFTVVDLGEPAAEPDKSGLEAAISAAEQLNAKDYTAEAWDVFVRKLWEAIELSKDETADQAAIDAMVSELKAACEEVDKNPDKTELNSVISAAKALKKEDYTPAAWAVFEKALKDAEAVCNNPKATQSQTAAAVAALKKAIDDVKKSPAQKPVQPAKVKVKKISISGLSKKIAAGKKVKLTAKVSPSNASNKSVTWKSSNKKVATVTSKGVVTMKKKSGGKSVTITATAKDGSKVKATYKIKSMKGKVTKVTISGKKTVKAGKTLKLTGKVKATKNANKKLKWTSSNKKYATVTSSGKVKALKAGKGKRVKITAMATDGTGKKKTVTIKITK